MTRRVWANGTAASEADSVLSSRHRMSFAAQRAPKGGKLRSMLLQKPSVS